MQLVLAHLSVTPGSKMTSQLVDVSLIGHVCISTPAPARHFSRHETQGYWWSTSTSRPQHLP